MQASLYVGELHPDVNEVVLHELFSQIGPVASIRICRDAITRRSLGYAYVNFHNLSDCERALETLNYVPIKGIPCRIMWSQRDPALRRSGAGNVFIKNLDEAIDNKALHDTFSAFGNIMSCKVVLNAEGKSCGFGFVHFENQEAADLAIEKVNGMLMNGKKVFVGRHISRKERHSRLEELRANFTNVFVKNLEESVDDDALTAMFEPFGEIQSAVIQRDEAGRSKGFGFVNFVCHEAAQAACDALNEKELGEGRRLYVGRAQKKSERMDELRRQFENLKMERNMKYQGVNLYVKNLDEQVDENRLKEEFMPFGQLASVKLMVDEVGRSRGFGFVCFSAPEEASKAIAELNGKLLFGKPLYVAHAQRKDERRAQLETQFAQRAQQLRYQQMAAAGMGIYQQGPLFFQQPRFPAGGPAAAGMAAPGAPRPGFPVPPTGYPPMMAPPGANGPRGPMRPGRGGFHPRGGMAPGGPMRPRQQPYGQQRFFPRPPVDAPLTAAILAQAAPEDQKRMIGERLFFLVNAIDAASSKKVTGMLLDSMDNGELLHLLESPEALNGKVAEAIQVLRQHESAQAASAPGPQAPAVAAGRA
jgi:polyadenylate-binding protein